MKKIDVNFKKPTQQQLNSLLEHYQAGRYVDAEKLSVSITEEFPKHPFAWKILGAVFKLKGKINESLVAFKKSVQLDPQDAEAHNNLGVILKELERLDEAEESYTQAIKLKPEFVEAHHNLSNTLKELGRLDEAEESLRQAIKYKPDYEKAHNNLGNTLHELGRLDEAEESLRQAIKLKPDYEEAKHLLSALTGNTTNSAPREYVENLFNNYAKNFENSLLNTLEYKTPSRFEQYFLISSPIKPVPQPKSKTDPN